MNLLKKREGMLTAAISLKGHDIDPLTHQTELDYGIEPLLCIGKTQRAPLHLIRI